jgi:hypothetical protein
MSTTELSSPCRPIELLERRYLLAVFGPDVSFGIGGHVGVPGHYVVAPLGDGQLLVVGSRRVPVPGPDSMPNSLMIASRLNSDGTLDASFGDGGSVKFQEAFDGQSSDAKFSGSRLWVIVPPTGAVDVPELRAYTPELVLDTSFSDDGRLEVPTGLDFDFPGDSASANILGVTEDGGVILFARIDDFEQGSGLTERDELIKLRADGTLDPAFGDGGVVSDVFISGLRWTSHGLVRAGEAPSLERFLADGFTPDPSFGVAGVV